MVSDGFPLARGFSCDPLFDCLPIESPRHFKNVTDIVVAFVTRVFVEWLVALHERVLSALRAVPDRVIVNSRFVTDCLVVDASGSFNHMPRLG